MATTALLGLWAQTSIHAGAGSSVDGIDLPIQREAHTGWPCIFGSAVKGALRAKAEGIWGKKNNSVRYVFGPDSKSDDNNEIEQHAGALMVSDARLLLLPVRSLTGYFKWVSCPALLKRLQRDIERFNIEKFNIKLEKYEIPTLENSDTGLQAQAQGDLFLEEYKISTNQTDLAVLIEVLSQLSGIEQKDLTEQLVIVSDTLFSYLCQYATPVTAHIAIDNEKKITKTGALWYEETLPPETVFYVGLAANMVRDNKAVFDDNTQVIKDSAANTILKGITMGLFDKNNKPYLQLGGNETLGMGWCKVSVINGD